MAIWHFPNVYYKIFILFHIMCSYCKVPFRHKWEWGKEIQFHYKGWNVMGHLSGCKRWMRKRRWLHNCNSPCPGQSQEEDFFLSLGQSMIHQAFWHPWFCQQKVPIRNCVDWRLGGKMAWLRIWSSGLTSLSALEHVYCSCKMSQAWKFWKLSLYKIASLCRHKWGCIWISQLPSPV